MKLLSALLSAAFFLHAVSAAAIPESRLRTRAPPAFIGTDGRYFSVDGYKFTPVGANAYWITLANLSDKDLDKSFKDIAGMGATTVRVFGFNEMAESNTAPNMIYYQTWNGKQATVNTGANGFGYFDRVIASAKRNNLRLIVALTSNYNMDYVMGGAPTYIRQILDDGQWHWHEEFYTNAEIKSAFKNYVSAIVTRYKDEPTIMSWELGHELKCAISWNPQNPVCDPTKITSWIDEISTHVKSLDSNHLVASGEEGFYNRPGTSQYIYNGRDGLDFEANIALKNVDYGTFSYRPASYEIATGSDAPLKWIDEHGKTQSRAGKPVLLNEIGGEIRSGWLDQVVKSGIAGTLYWQAGSDVKLNMPFWFRGDSISPGSDTFAALTKHAQALKDRP